LISRLMPWNTLDNSDVALPIYRLDDKFTGEFSSLEVIRTDEGGDHATRLLQRGGIHSRVHNHDGNMCLVRLYYGRNDFPRTARGNADCIDFALNEVLDNLHLLSDI